MKIISAARATGRKKNSVCRARKEPELAVDKVKQWLELSYLVFNSNVRALIS